MKSEYEIQADEFLKKANTRMHISHCGIVKGFPFDKKDSLTHNKYQVTLIRGKEQYRFVFYDSFYNYLHCKRPTHYDILASVEKYDAPHNVKDFAAEFGYDIDEYDDYLRVEKIMKACNKQYYSLLCLFGEELMKDLQEIQ